MSDDLELLERWRSGDRDAGDALLSRHLDSLYRFFHTKFASSEAEELVQSTLLACLDAKDRFRGTASFRTFLFSIARHKVYHQLRARKLAELDVGSVADTATTVRSALDREQSKRALADAMRLLPVEQQMLMALHYWEELDTVELAGVFDVPAATIRTWLFRARGKLRELLA